MQKSSSTALTNGEHLYTESHSFMFCPYFAPHKDHLPSPQLAASLTFTLYKDILILCIEYLDDIKKIDLIVGILMDEISDTFESTEMQSSIKDEDSKFFATLTPQEARVVELLIIFPEEDERSIAARAGIERSVVKKTLAKSSVRNYLNKKSKERTKAFLTRQNVIFERISDKMMEELETRFQISNSDRKDFYDLIRHEGFTANEAKAIMSNRIEGMPVKDLVSIMSDMSKTASRVHAESEESTELEVEVIEGMSRRYHKYKAKIKNLDASKFSPDDKISTDTIDLSRRKEDLEEGEIIEAEFQQGEE